MIRPVDVLLEFLEAEQTRGVTHVHLDEGAREGLRELFNRAKNGSIIAPPVETNIEPEPIAVASPPTISGSSRLEQLESLRQQAETSTSIRALGSLRETLVFSSGSPDARVMLVGEAPGYQEEREGLPFLGDSGQKLTDILKAMGLSREEVYLSYIVKFRPSTPRQTTNNRKPTPEEMAACLPFVRAEIGIVKPECIIALGETAAAGLLGLAGSIASMRGPWYDFDGTPVCITYHPSTLLQTQGAHSTKRHLWEDMLAVMEKLCLPISDKQRGYFLPKA